MKIVLVAMLVLASCTRIEEPEKKGFPIIVRRDTVVIHDTLDDIHHWTDWQRKRALTNDPERDTIWGKPVRYYIDDSAISWTAMDFYYGGFRPDDNGATHEMLAHVYTGNDKLRPFYRWCLSETIRIQDGPLSSRTGEPARRYVEKFPQEFIDYIDHDTTGEIAREWADAINSSGIRPNEDGRNVPQLHMNLLTAMTQNCTDCDARTIARVEEFVRLCFFLETAR